MKITPVRQEMVGLRQARRAPAGQVGGGRSGAESALKEGSVPSRGLACGRHRTNRQLRGGFALAGATLVELMVTVALSGLMLMVVLGSHLLGLRMYNISATKLSASAGARQALDSVRRDVRSAKLLYVGMGGADWFSNAPAGSAQTGNALQIYPTVNTNVWMRYYLDGESKTLRRTTSSHSAPEVMARTVTNLMAFQAETHAGTVLTNNTNHRVVRMLLEFYQWEFPVAKVGGHYDYYRLHTRVTRRAIE